MVADPNKISLLPEATHTEPESTTHPVKALFHSLGFDTSHFPSLKFVIEASEKSIRTGRIVLPLRVPEHPGFVYESVIRILRVLEVPTTGAVQEHRKFFEIEWLIADEATLDEHNHPALSFLAAQVECASCHEIFVPDPEIINDTSLRLVCPNCLNHWSVSVSAPRVNDDQVELLFDLYHREPQRVRNLITKWSEQSVGVNDRQFYALFPFHFEKWPAGSSLEWLFGEIIGWGALANSKTHHTEFDHLIKGFINSLALEHFKKIGSAGATAQLEKTEVQRKSEITQKTPTVIDPDRVSEILEKTPVAFKAPRLVPDSNFTWTAPDTKVKEIKALSTSQIRRQQRQNASLFFSLGAALIVALTVVGIFLFQFKLQVVPKSAVESATVKQDYVAAAPVEAPPAAAPSAVPTPSPTTSPEPIQKTLPVQNVAAVEVPVRNIEAPTKKKPAKTESAPPRDAETAEQKRIRALAIDSSFRQGMVHLKLQQTKEAIVEFRRVITLDPRNADAHRGLGLAYVYEQNFQNAIDSLSKYLSLSSNADDRPSVEELIATLRDRSTQAQQ